MARLAAGVRKRPDGKLEKRFTVDGKRYSVYGMTQKEVLAKEQEIREQIKEGIYTDNKNLTLDKYFNEWIENKKGTVKGRSICFYSSVYRNKISPKLGKVKIVKLERRQAIEFQKEVLKESSVSYTNMAMRVLKTILNDAVRDEIIAKNPASSIKALKVEEKASETNHRALTIEEQHVFMEEMKKEYYYEMVAFLLSTGMRIGEAIALTWDDIDKANKVVHITKTLTRTAGGERTIGTPKTDSGKRDIPITDGIERILKAQKEKNLMCNGFGSVTAKSFVFLTPRGLRVNERTVCLGMRKALVRVNEGGFQMDHITPHCLRATFATRFIEQGGNPQTLKTILGHSSFSMTMDLYSHVLPNTKQEEMNRTHIII